MSPTIRRMLWGAFAGLTLLIVVVVASTITLLQMQQKQDSTVVRQSLPLIEAVHEMDQSLTTMVSASRGYLLSKQSAFKQQYDDSALEFGKAQSQADSYVVHEKDR